MLNKMTKKFEIVSKIIQTQQAALNDLEAKLWCLTENNPDRYGELYEICFKARKEVEKIMEEK